MVLSENKTIMYKEMKYAIVTGGTKGIGKQICIDLLLKGYFVITNYASDDQSAEAARDLFTNYSTDFEVIKIDQSKASDLEVFVQFIRNKTREIHCIICNAGDTLRKGLDTITNHEWELMFMLNVHSHFYLIRDLNSIIQKKSRIIFIGSVFGEIPHTRSLAYGVTKSAVHALAKNLVKEFSEREVTVNVVAPGLIETIKHRNLSLEIRENIYNKTAAKRFGTTEEVSKVCMMIIDNDFINGATILVDGGYNYK
jgi:3-oxoacyl-[acyl-carrier protein] reductase